MLFADDSYLYCKANETEADHVLTLLQNFERASGQKVNLNKSVVFFSSNIIESNRARLCQRLSMEEAGADCGKEILVKSVAQTLPTYAMYVFLLPAEIHRDIERTISKFWRNSRTGDRKGIHWMSWDRLSRHKSVGGMGFQDFKDFNLALLGKQGWHILTKPSSLVSRVYKARYFPTVNFLEAKIGHNPSYIWRSILEAKELVASGIRWKVGTGEDINILSKPWLLDSERPYIESDSIALENNKISSLMNVNQRSWDEEILRDLFTERDQECIKKINIGEYGERDELYWN
ncbi:hypothetical protein AgCh_005895 [Apium graveolens]